MTPDKDIFRCDKCGRFYKGKDIRETSVGIYCYDCLCSISDELLIAIDEIEEEKDF